MDTELLYFDSCPNWQVVECHLKTRPFVCREKSCAKTFNTCGNMTAHERKVHKQKYEGKLPSLLSLVPNLNDYIRKPETESEEYRSE